MKALPLTLALSLTACFDVRGVVPVAPDTYRFTVASHALVVAPQDQAIVEDTYSRMQCPRGYEKQSERVTVTNGRPTYSWVARCL